MFQLQTGDVILFRPQARFPRPKWFLERAICWYQKQKFGDGADTAFTHVAVVLPNGVFFEATHPRARLFQAEELAGKDYVIYRYKRFDLAAQYPQGSPQALAAPALNDAARKLVGRPYDYLDLVSFALEKLIGFAQGAYKLVTDIFGAKWKEIMFKLIGQGDDQFVCSTAIAAVFVAVQKACGKTETGADVFPRPFITADGGKEYIEFITPAHFACWGDFEEVV